MTSPKRDWTIPTTLCFAILGGAVTECSSASSESPEAGVDVACSFDGGLERVDCDADLEDTAS
jgi:hypothetical protein